MGSHVIKRWSLLPHDRDLVASLADQLRVSAIVAQLLLNRGISDATVARRFLDAPLTGLHGPELLPGVTAAADLLFDAVEKGRKICVYGDYDADGVTGTAILLQCLRLLGADKTDIHVPHRLEEGYGLNVEALRKIADSGAAIVVTVDCGIASLTEAEEARRLGLSLIVTDHHEFKPQLPDAAVLVHPRLPGSSYPFGHLSGAAVALKLAWALAQRASGGPKCLPRFREFLLDAVALAAIGVVADVVPLHDENRILVKHGLNRLKQQPPIGLKALFESAAITIGNEIRSSDIGYKIGPRLNAAGRLGCARLVVDLLTTNRKEQAIDLARYLEEQNAARQKLERSLVTEVREVIDAQSYGTQPAIVVAGANWHGGVIGIVAGRIAEQYSRPSLVIALPNGDVTHAVGSGRSVAGFPLHLALDSCADILIGHGGHAAAAGLRILPERIDAFRERFCAYAAAHFPGGPPDPRLVIDAEVPLSALTLDLLDDLDRLEPYGAGNTEPVFLAAGLKVLGEPRKIGQGQRTLSFRIQQNGVTMKAVGFGMADRAEELMSHGGACCLAFAVKKNVWQGRTSVDLILKDFQAGAEAKLD